MRFLVYETPQCALAVAIHKGLGLLAHAPYYRHPAHFVSRDTEPCDAIVVVEASHNAKLICEAYHRAVKEPHIFLFSPAPVRPSEFVQARYYTWESLPECECPKDRADKLGFTEDKCEIRDGVLHLDGEAVAEVDNDTPVQPWLNRLAYAVWTEAEVGTGAPFRFAFRVLQGNYPALPEADGAAETAEIAAATAPVAPERVIPVREPEATPADANAMLAAVWPTARSRGMRKADLQAHLAKGVEATAAALGVEPAQLYALARKGAA